MLNMKYINHGEIYSVGFSIISENIVYLRGNLPAETDGFILSRDGHEDCWDYTGYTTIYRVLHDGIQFSRDGSVYVEPEIPEPIPVPEPYVPTVEELAEQEQRRKETEAVPSCEELSAALMELAENISDIEDAIAELGEIMA